MSKKYIGVEDLLLDESFLSWYFRTDDRCILQWEAWMASDPQNRARARQAVAFLRWLTRADKEILQEQITQSESRLLAKIREAEERVVVPMAGRGVRWRWVAAASVLLVVAGIYTILKLPRIPPAVHTAYGEIKENRLPDGTTVVMNADSKLTFSPGGKDGKDGWKDGKDREVWLTGEAFFHVAKTPLKSRFIVHLNHFDVIVTGTQFNAVNRGQKANVMLKEGSVILHTDQGKELKMAPGDFVEYRNTGLQKKTAKADSVLAWKEHKLIFYGTPLRKLVEVIEEDYGVKVLIKGDSVGSKPIYGILSNDNLDVLLEALKATGDFAVERQIDDTITISDTHP
ncbi:MAG TPA: FecR domain-containing protein [Puia sp.]|jgi:ferric-dicitrate binding protein FerR (iron transport regulator)|nr:FecR domain-containing protein [Puia sp.]